MKVRRTGAAAVAICWLAAVPATLGIAQAQTQPPSERPAHLYEGIIVKIKVALRLDEAQLKLWAPMEAQLRAAFAARQKVRADAVRPFYAALSDKQKDVADVILRPVVDAWPAAVYRVQEERDVNGYHRVLMHGRIMRGAQRILDERGRVVDDTVPTTYYYPRSPIGMTIAKRREILAAQGKKGRYGIVGLWTGSIACHKQEGETWKFFESDPTIIKIAKDPKNFTFISKCQPDIDIAIGEARLMLAREPDSGFDLLYIDTIYSADGIQVPMMTKEAVELYLSKLKPDGVVLLHTSNRYLDLDSVLGAILKILPEGTAGIAMTDRNASRDYGQSLTTNVIFAKSAKALEPYRSSLEGVSDLEDNGLPAWTDDYSDVWAAWRGR